jgi:flavin reductase (DIM6/NTAB) family NADH-FMN oxidoreductase RutF/rubredoxin
MNIEAYFRITYGLYVVSARSGDKLNGYISNTVFQVTSDPPRFAIACSKNNRTCNMIRASRAFAFSVLEKDISADVIGTFGYRSGKDVDKFGRFKYITGKTGSPILVEQTIAWFECRLIRTIDAGSHLIFIGEVVDGDLLNSEKEPLTYNYYRDVRKGKAPKNAPTYIDDKVLREKKEIRKAKIYKCPVCGYIYDPVKADPENGYPAGTPFEELPEDWVCPVCGTGKKEFTEQTGVD